MTETATVTMCDTLVPSPLDAGQQLACFRRPHAGDPWHYDTRGMGVAFRVRDPLTLDVEAHIGLTPGQAAARPAAPEPVNLPAPLGDSAGHLDVDRLRALSPAVRTGLIDALRSSATEMRAARGTVVVPEDTYDLVRRLTAAGEVLRQWRDAFEAAAKEADALTAEEALTAVGEQDGVPMGSLFVPDGAGQRIAVRPDFASGDSTWDVPTLVGWLIEDEVADRAAAVAHEGTAWTETDAAEVARGVVDRLLALGRFTPGAKPVEELRKRLASAQRDADAGIIRQVRHVGPRTFRGVKIVREEAK